MLPASALMIGLAVTGAAWGVTIYAVSELFRRLWA